MKVSDINGALNNIAEYIHQESEAHGFDGKQLQFGTHLMRVVSELGEALEADRLNDHADFELFNEKIGEGWTKAFEEAIKDTIEDELTDAIIMLLYLCKEIGMDIDKHLRHKMIYNSMREPKNGKRY